MKLNRACLVFVSALTAAPTFAADAPPVPAELKLLLRMPL